MAVFLTSFSLLWALTTAKSSPAGELKRRLRLLERDKTWHNMPEDLRVEIVRETPPLERLLARIPLLGKTEALLDKSGLKIPPLQFQVLVLAFSVVVFVLVFLIRRDFLLASMMTLLILVAPYPVLINLIQRRRDKFTEQLPDVLTMIARSLRAGHAFSSSLELVGKELHNPAGELFKTAFEQQRLGLPITDTLINMTERIDSVDLRFFVLVISINTDVGGNLAEILDKLAETIRERLKIRRQVKVYTAQGRMSGYLLAILPIITFIALNLLMPGYEDVLTKEKPGQYLLLLAVAWQIIGFLFIRKIINIRI
jgi:tight adherence protein B